MSASGVGASRPAVRSARVTSRRAEVASASRAWRMVMELESELGGCGVVVLMLVLALVPRGGIGVAGLA